ncbi:MAG: DNA mismatch endonuclease Vsr [Prevotellaceae bacterium]|nr:DNA mismatch endonuclease Vsr [Candidatus Faecinaster equi]
MSDHMTAQQRHECMSNIHSKDTRPEQVVRRELWHRGYRFRKCVRTLPGTPDIVLPKYRTCIFVNGCFWHGHKDCQYATRPKTNQEFWRTKIENNRERDLRDYTFLESLGWRVIVVWECELKKDRIDDTIACVRKQLDANRESWIAEQADRRQRREEWQAEIRKRKERALKFGVNNHY